MVRIYNMEFEGESSYKNFLILLTILTFPALEALISKKATLLSDNTLVPRSRSRRPSVAPYDLKVMGEKKSFLC